jgi:RNA-binding proteins (RRM domain)
MNNKLYVGNLAFGTTENDLNELFSSAGTVREATVITDRDTGNSRGFGFVVMGNAHEAEVAINQFNDRDFQGRNLAVNIAREREARPAGNGHNRDRRPARRF